MAVTETFTPPDGSTGLMFWFRSIHRAKLPNACGHAYAYVEEDATVEASLARLGEKYNAEEWDLRLIEELGWLPYLPNREDIIACVEKWQHETYGELPQDIPPETEHELAEIADAVDVRRRQVETQRKEIQKIEETKAIISEIQEQLKLKPGIRKRAELYLDRRHFRKQLSKLQEDRVTS